MSKEFNTVHVFIAGNGGFCLGMGFVGLLTGHWSVVAVCALGGALQALLFGSLK